MFVGRRQQSEATTFIGGVRILTSVAAATAAAAAAAAAATRAVCSDSGANKSRRLCSAAVAADCLQELGD